MARLLVTRNGPGLAPNTPIVERVQHHYRKLHVTLWLTVPDKPLQTSVGSNDSVQALEHGRRVQGHGEPPIHFDSIEGPLPGPGELGWTYGGQQCIERPSDVLLGKDNRNRPVKEVVRIIPRSNGTDDQHTVGLHPTVSRIELYEAIERLASGKAPEAYALARGRCLFPAAPGQVLIASWCQGGLEHVARELGHNAVAQRGHGHPDVPVDHRLPARRGNRSKDEKRDDYQE